MSQNEINVLIIFGGMGLFAIVLAIWAYFDQRYDRRERERQQRKSA
jgi:hypothetical protein